MAAERPDGSELLTFQYVKRRPMHPDRFLKFARRFFGPLGQDHTPDESPPAPPPLPWPICSALVAASGCIWFVGSDDMRGEWLAEVAGGRHLLRCGAAWPEVADEGTGAGERRVELALALQVVTAEASSEEVVAALRRELDACLVTRAEAMALESGGDLFQITAEWETIRAHHKELSSWADQWLPALLLLRLSTRIVGSVPGFEALASLGQQVTRCLKRLLRGASASGNGAGTTDTEDDSYCLSTRRPQRS